ncbi:2559_t:CDS:10 [Ambispora gerdemannii]|uniref:2559_t:CDS:1 n=1 Tax=Ambispora gerdemannii TaxID=144530 RepID=A0A9N9DD72_9GLOM|nr:2559_t:CDS:10 [Ambispora gerdemannii]
MSDSYFGFDTTMPPLNSDQLTAGTAEITEDELSKNFEAFALESGQDFGVYGYDPLADQLVETGDDYNEETFGNDITNIGDDFDFTQSNAKIADTIQKEEKIYVDRRENVPSDNNELIRQRPLFSNLWDDQAGIAVNGNGSYPNDPTTSPLMPESPISPSIWGSYHPPSTRKGLASNNRQEFIQFSAMNLTNLHHPSYENPPNYPPSQISPLPPGFGPPPVARVPTLEEIEKQLQRQAGQSSTIENHQLQRQAGPPPQSQLPPPMHNSPLPEKRMLSLAEVEAALLGMNSRPPPLPIYGQTEGVYREQETAFLEQEAAIREQETLYYERERKLREKQRKLTDMAKYNGLMTQNDKDYINRIQISQLVTDDPYSDDFYYQVYTAIRNRQTQSQMGPFSPNASGGGAGQERRHRNRGSESGMLKMQQQVLRIVNDARRKPKSTQLSLEGALGKIALNSVRNPRQLLQVSAKHTDTLQTHASPSGGTHHKVPSITLHGIVDHRKVLRSIENIYSAVLGLEELRRNQHPQSRQYSDQEREDKWLQEKYTELARKMWEELHVTDPIGISFQHPFISILSVSKGKKVIPRVLRHCNQDQIGAMIRILVANFETLDVCKAAIGGSNGNIKQSILDEVELFMNTVVPPLLQFVAEAPLKIVIGLLTLFIERNNIIWVAKSKVGLAFLTMFLSRAEILKQGGGAMQGLPPPEDREIMQWQESYNRLFSQLQNYFLSSFPPFTSNIDDMYVWQFLAAMAVGASMEQQHVLVTEIRERVLETVVQASRMPHDKAAHKITNVNLFLHALGLDASQLKI